MDRILTVEQAAELMHVCENTMRHWLRTGKVPGRKLGRVWRISEEALRRWLEVQADAGLDTEG